MSPSGTEVFKFYCKLPWEALLGLRKCGTYIHGHYRQLSPLGVGMAGKILYEGEDPPYEGEDP